jgi:hypothetical protein
VKLFDKEPKNTSLGFVVRHTRCNKDGSGEVYQPQIFRECDTIAKFDNAYLDIASMAGGFIIATNAAQITCTKISVSGILEKKAIIKDFENMADLTKFLHKHDLITINKPSSVCTML